MPTGLDGLHFSPIGNSSAAVDIPWTQDSVDKITGVIDPCLDLPDAPCYLVYYYHADIDLAGFGNGFIASAETCCRPINAININYQGPFLDYQNPPPPSPPAPAPGYSCSKSADMVLYMAPAGNGILSFVKVPPLTLINSSPQFASTDTILSVCTGKHFSYFIKANDPDGDSVAYHFTTPRTYTYNSGSIFYFGNYSELYYNPGYSEQAQAGSTLTLNQTSGLLQGSVPAPGTYLLTVSALEYRGGQPLDSVTQDLFVQVYDCAVLPKPVASMPDSINSCADFTVLFPNTSTPIYTNINWNYTNFLWNFGDGDTSSQVYPTHTYTDTGTYNLRLIIFPGLYCADTTYSKVLVYPFVNPNFTVSGMCSDLPINFVNTTSSSGTSGSVIASQWKVMIDSTTYFSSHAFDTSYIFKKAPATYEIYLTVQTTKGCSATDSQSVTIWQSPYPLASHDTILARGATLQLKANDGNFNYNGQFLWSPPEGLNNTMIPDPILTSTQDNTYFVSMTNSHGCSLEDSIAVKYYTGPNIYVPNAFTPNGDGINDLFRPVMVGISTMEYFRVFNRYGQLIYQTSQPGQGWDGSLGGKPAAADTYVWQVAGVDYLGKLIAKKGTVVLIR
jgi:gliding motility-associated-like protein